MPYGNYRGRKGGRNRSASTSSSSFSSTFSGGRSRQSKTRGGNSRSRVKRTSNPKSRLLSDKKINTLVEVRMQEIAKKEVEKGIKLLTKRNYLFHSYDPVTNEYDVLAPRSDLIDWTGSVVELSNIAKTDTQTRPNVPQVDDPETMVDENADGDGPNQLMAGVPMDGRRWGDIIYLKSVVANIRVRSFELTDSDLDLFQTIKVKYAFVLLRDEETVMTDPTDEPDANELLMMHPFGYQAKLDPELNMVFHGRKKTVLCQGETILNINDTSTSEKFHTIYKKFPKPIMIKYPVLDQNGQTPNKKVYFVCRSTIPAASGYDDIKPSLYACTKLNYYEA